MHLDSLSIASIKFKVMLFEADYILWSNPWVIAVNGDGTQITIQVYNLQEISQDLKFNFTANPNQIKGKANKICPIADVKVILDTPHRHKISRGGS